jgi:hypothetical protein
VVENLVFFAVVVRHQKVCGDFRAIFVENETELKNFVVVNVREIPEN